MASPSSLFGLWAMRRPATIGLGPLGYTLAKKEEEIPPSAAVAEPWRDQTANLLNSVLAKHRRMQNAHAKAIKTSSRGRLPCAGLGFVASLQCVTSSRKKNVAPGQEEQKK